MPRRRWTEEKLKILRDSYGKLPKEKLIELLNGHTWESIKYAVRTYGIAKKYPPRWSKAEIETLKSIYQTKPWREIVKALPLRTQGAIRHRAYLLGLSHKRVESFVEGKIHRNEANEFELGWISAAIDSEGTITIAKIVHGNRFTLSPIIMITNTSLEFIKKAQEIFGGRIQKSPAGKRKWRDKWILIHRNIYGVYLTLDKIKDYLVIKRKHAELVHEFCKQRMRETIKTPYSKRALEIYDEIRRLNSKA